MSEEAVNNPHDKLFKQAFSRQEMAVDFFRNYLPADIHARIDWETLHLQPGTFTDEALRGSESDLLYTVKIDNHPTLLYCLFEHQSSPDPWMPLRLLRYIIGIWDQFRKQSKKATKLPPILPIILYQGGDTWTCDASLSSLIDIPAGLDIYQPDFQHLLVDLNQIASENIQGQPSLRTILLALKTSRDQNKQKLELLIRALAAIIHADPALIRSVMLYLYSVDNSTNITEYMNQAEALNHPQLREEIMTIAETLKNEGMQQGMQQTLHEGILEILDLRFQSVSYSIKKQIEEITDTAVLRKLHRLAVQTPTIEAFQSEITSL